MSYLIDEFQNTRTEIDGIWFQAKPLLGTTLKTKIGWCWEILKGKAIAVHFKEDREIECDAVS